MVPVVKVNLNKVEDLKNFVYVCSQIHVNVVVESDKGKVINGKSLLGLLTLNLSEPVNVILDTGDINIFNAFVDHIKEYTVEVVE